ncbi:MAG TPA: GTPase Era [Myxococcota bacterium]|nr:GTPase Era [Myxococcota bacterium]
MSFHVGTVALVGRPNAGKSSILNCLLGERLAAVSSRPQTTRNRVVGIHSTEELQAVILDTPGIHEAWTPLNESMVHVTESALEEVDFATWIVDAVPLVTAAKNGLPILDKSLQAIADKLPPDILVALNKVDVIKEKDWLLPVIAAFAPREVIPVSAKSKEGIAKLEAAWYRRLPEGEPLYPTDIYTDATERFVVAELIRERVMEHTSDEVPYATAVEVERFDESLREAGRVQIHAKILVEKVGQKAIVIGKGGAMIKQIGIEARKSIEALLGCHVRLELFVVVEEGWTTNPRMLKELGYTPPKKKVTTR